ncbi:MAG: N-formylglutamate amidohydrolase [bacterium]
MKKLPLLITVVHGGEKIPAELEKHNNLLYSDILEDIDTFSKDVYEFSDLVAGYLDTVIARPYVDLNRAVDDRPPKNPDGVVKTQTVFQVSVYKQGRFPDDVLIDQILQKYYYPFFRTLKEMECSPDIIAGFDCHTMLSHSPPISNDPGEKRPLVCLSNGGNKEGKSESERAKTSCSAELIQQLRENFLGVFNCSLDQVKINDPFQGGYIIRSRRQSAVPWIQIELNRKLYLNSKHPFKKNKERINVVKKLMFKVFEDFVRNWKTNKK